MIEKQYEELNFTDDFTRRLNSEVSQAQRKEEWRIEYMTLLQKDREKLLMCDSKASE